MDTSGLIFVFLELFRYRPFKGKQSWSVSVAFFFFFAYIAQVTAVVWKWPNVTLENCLTFQSLRLSFCKANIVAAFPSVSMECFEN